MKELIIEMLQMQIETNNLAAGPTWHQDNLEWSTAIWTECAELQDSLGWKWWKEGAVDLDNARVEVIDIWHFGLSHMLSQTGVNASEVDNLATRITAAFRESELSPYISTEDANVLVAKGALNGRFPLGIFLDLAKSVSLSTDLLRGIYIGKAALNAFRQHNGYADGTYQKMWEGKEDNAHMMDLLGAHNPLDPDLYANFMRDLSDKYSQVTGGDAYIQPVVQATIPDMPVAYPEGGTSEGKEDGSTSAAQSEDGTPGQESSHIEDTDAPLERDTSSDQRNGLDLPDMS
jgi:hypothetical protein